MTESSPTMSPRATTSSSSDNVNQTITEIPIEIVSEEEMALIEAAFAAVSRSSLSPVKIPANVRSIQSITYLSKRRLSGIAETSSAVGDIEDSVSIGGTQKRIRAVESLLHRFRRKRGLSVTDITATEWCEKQMEFFLLFGKPKASKAMRAGSARHTQLEEEVVKRVKVRVTTMEDVWAIKFMNFILGANQLLLDGLTREIPIVGFVDGVWMVGVIDEIRMPISEFKGNPTLVDTKTRVQATIPSEPQRRNGRLQLMCYKYLWDNIAADKFFPSRRFFDFFSLDPNYILTEELRESTANSGFPAKTLDDMVRYFRNTCCTLPLAHDELLLRYEFQKDNSLLAEDVFAYDSDWVKGQLQNTLEFWRGDREAEYTPEDERWKCRSCRYASECKANTNPECSKS